MKIHHLGIATDNSEKVSEFVNKTHSIISQKGPLWDPNLNANLIIFEVKEGISIEVVSGPIVQSLVKKKINLYHFCYEVNDIKSSIKQFKNNGSTLIQKPKPALLFNSRLVAFLMTPLGIIELLEK